MKLGVQLTAKAGPSLDSLSWLMKSWGGRQLLPSSGHRALSLVKKFTQTINYAIIHRSTNAYFPPETEHCGTNHQQTQCHASTLCWWQFLCEVSATGQGNCQSTTTQTMSCFSTMSRWRFICQKILPHDKGPFLLQQKHNAMLQHHEQMTVHLPGVSATGQQHINNNTNNAISCFSIIHRRWFIFPWPLPQTREQCPLQQKHNDILQHHA